MSFRYNPEGHKLSFLIKDVLPMCYQKQKQPEKYRNKPKSEDGENPRDP